ncbi:hypothetical protein C5167_038365 [Papaver somniferum]|uniref:Uncharacterized protein n=1 Tax=Papaver somniferum TaxID=3469 RepID=A0A4Y7ICP7_PAPSO|nr:hypothetical protein C5167_038365 [Papaver somniferum]
MALPFAFQERLQQMEETRNQRLTLLQINAASKYKILAYKSEIESVEARYQTAAHQFSELIELEESEKEKERFYEMKNLEMKEFRENVDRCLSENRLLVQEIKKSIDEVTY